MKNFRDLANLLNEAPVTDIGTIGDFSKPGGFRNAGDKHLVAGPGRLETIKAAWGESEHDFRLFFAQFKGGGKWLEHGLVDEHDLAELQKLTQLPKPLTVPDAITVVFTNNIGDQRVPLTPWVIAHRCSHSLFRARLKDKNLEHSWTELTEVIERFMDELADQHNLGHEQYLPKADKMRGFGDFGNFTKLEAHNKKRRTVAHAFGAMRSAREGNLRNFSEFIFETVAQYLITGKVILADQHRPVVTSVAWGRPQTRGPKDKAEVETIKRDYAYEVPTYIDNVLYRAKGQLFVM